MQFGKDEKKRIPLGTATPAGTGPASATMPSDAEMLQSIKETIAGNKIAIFMKGTPAAPMCGFSATVVDIFNEMKVPFVGVNAIENPKFRYVLSEHSNWPTLPQIFVGGKLIGGCDIVRELKASGELDKIVAEALR
jgi:monothiol glutaredoxin